MLSQSKFATVLAALGLCVFSVQAQGNPGSAIGPAEREAPVKETVDADVTDKVAKAVDSAASVPHSQQNYWGFGIGYVFNRIPISLSTFNVPISDLWYSHIFGDPDENTRIAGTVGFYGFQVLLPVPKFSVDMYYGKPSADIQYKGGVGGFYDVTVGGHGGLTGEIGVVLKNRVDLSFMAVPLGTDSKRSYSEFLGLETKAEAEESRAAMHGHYVELPYYAVKVGLRF